MKFKKSLLLLVFILNLIVPNLNSLFAQDAFQKGYFTFPVKPGQINFLSGSMGELRTNHFHGGIDIKTEARIGLPIFAAAEGYISRIRVSTSGYGNMIHITHPNGLVTVYAHLEKFNDKLWDYTLKKQYEKESFEIDLSPGKDELLVKKGELIAYGGNTGGSRGPHLHFEIRDVNNKMYNPLFFGFNEIKDNLPPIFDKIALNTFSIHSRIEDEFGRYEAKPIKVGKNYEISRPINANGLLGLEIKALDKMNGTHNSYGITCIEVKMDGEEIFYHNLKTFNFDENRYINSHINYEYFTKTGRRFEKCYIPDGNKLSTYKQFSNKGKIFINDSLKHKVEVTIYDAYNNSSKLIFFIKGEKNNQKTTSSTLQNNYPGITEDLFENIIRITGKAGIDDQAKIYAKNRIIPLDPAYFKNGLAVYLFDLRKGLPDSVEVGGKIKDLNYVAMAPSGKEFVFKNPRLQVKFPADALFDTLYMKVDHKVVSGKEIFQINDASTPVFTLPEYTLYPYKPIIVKNLTHVYGIKSSSSFEGGVWNGESIKFNSKNLGKFTLGLDNEKPVIKLISSKGNHIRFNIFDRNSGIASFRATINGQWILMSYDHKRNLIWSELLDKDMKIKGDFELEVKDRAGNVSTYRTKVL